MCTTDILLFAKLEIVFACAFVVVVMLIGYMKPQFEPLSDLDLCSMTQGENTVCMRLVNLCVVFLFLGLQAVLVCNIPHKSFC